MTDVTKESNDQDVAVAAPTISEFESVGEIFIRRMSDLDLGTQDVAHALNFASPNVVSMIRSRRMRLPVNRLFLAASYLQVDPVYMLRCMGEEMKRDSDDERLLEVAKIALGQELLTEGEMKLIRMVRKHTHNREFDLEKDFPEEWELVGMALEDVGKKMEKQIESYTKIRKRRGPAPGTTRKKVAFDIANPPGQLTPEKALEQSVAPQVSEEDELRALAQLKKNVA